MVHAVISLGFFDAGDAHNGTYGMNDQIWIMKRGLDDRGQINKGKIKLIKR